MRERERMKLYQSLYRSWVLRLMEENGAPRLGSHMISAMIFDFV